MTAITHFAGRFLRLVSIGHWEFVERTKASGVVAILAITPDDRILLVEQFRPPVQSRVIELPAGLAGDIDGAELEQLTEAARRELLEETGYLAATLKTLGAGPSSAGLTSEVITFFEATGLTRQTAGGGDASESIIVHAVPLAELRSWLRSKTDAGFMTDFKIAAALALSGRGMPLI